jgi:RecB family endonuclease NucS
VVVASTREALCVFRLTGGIEGQPESLDPVTFASVGALELRHIEEWLKKEPTLLGEDLLVVASQLASFDKTRDRPDLLALDAAGKLVVVEIKRDESGSAQDLQALRYAAYVSTLQADQVIDLFRSYRGAEHGESLSRKRQGLVLNRSLAPSRWMPSMRTSNRGSSSSHESFALV